MNVASFFDGLSCSQLALKRAGITVKNYYSSEVDPWAIKVTQANFPETIQLGDITKIPDDYFKDKNIDLVIGGSPCQGFSFASKHHKNFEDERSQLFFDFVRLLKQINPRWFLLENVKMTEPSRNIISNYLGVEPVMINSSLVSSQNRKRFYWTNIPFEMPQDKGIHLEDILEGSKWGSDRQKSHCLDASYYKGAGKKSVSLYFKKSRRQIVFDKCILAGHADLKGYDIIKRVYDPRGKAPTLTTCQGGHRQPKVAVGAFRGRYQMDGSTKQQLELRLNGKSNALTTVQKDNVLTMDSKYWRRLSPLECERLQTVPDDYTNHVSSTQRYKMLGNGMTVDVIAHILIGTKNKEA